MNVQWLLPLPSGYLKLGRWMSSWGPIVEHWTLQGSTLTVHLPKKNAGSISHTLLKVSSPRKCKVYLQMPFGGHRDLIFKTIRQMKPVIMRELGRKKIPQESTICLYFIFL